MLWQFWQGGLNGIKNTVDKRNGLLYGIPFGNLQGFIDGDLRWSLVTKPQFKNSYSENIPVHQGHSLHPPIMGMLGEKGVDFVNMKTDSLYQLAPIRERSYADIKNLAKHIQVCRYRVRRARTLLKIVTEQELQGHFP